jgi:uncharacterized membrane protein YkvA (DUF1232 family)
MKVIEKGKQLFQWILRNGYLLYLIVRHPKTPWYLRLLMFVPLAYVLFPMDIVSDFVPFFGQLDDVVVLRYGYLVLFKMIPSMVLEESRERAKKKLSQINWKKVKKTVVIVSICLVLTAVGSIYLLTRLV